MKDLVSSLAEAYIAPRFIMSFLIKNFDLDAHRETVINAIREGKVSERYGRSDCQGLTRRLKRKGFLSRIHLDENGRVMSMFFMFRLTLAYLYAYWHVLVLDCTYKTNKYEMPLLDMVDESSKFLWF
jgi:hypothetical protein